MPNEARSSLVPAAALALVATACDPTAKVHSTLATTVGGREIKAQIDGPAFLQPEESTATVRFDGHEVRVEKHRVLVDGKERAKIDAAAKHVMIVRSGATLTVSVEGTTVLSDELAQ